MTHVLDDARGQMREGRDSWKWELLAREKAARTLLETEEFTADDLADLNIPQKYRRHVHGAATGYWSGEQRCMDYVERVKSKRPSRKGGKNDLYRINAKGRRELVRLLRDVQSELQTLVGGSGEPASGASQLAAASSQDQTSQLAGSSCDAFGGSHVAAGSGEKEIVGIGTEGEKTSSDTLGANSGDGCDGAGLTLPQKRGASPPVGTAAGSVSSPDHSQDTIAGEGTAASTEGAPTDSSLVAGDGVPGVLQLDEIRPKTPSAYDPWAA